MKTLKSEFFCFPEMIHNPNVNADLIARGVRFIMDTFGQNDDELG